MTPITSPNRARSATHRRALKARARRSFDGVVASYLRELRAADDTVRGRRVSASATR